MDKKELVLAVLSTLNQDSYTPAQIQKLFFLIDKRLSVELNGPFFDFKPYDYGPFDKAVYNTLNELKNNDDVEMIYCQPYGPRQYRLTSKGQEEGQEILKKIDRPIAQYIKDLSEFVRSMSFAQLVSSIYKAYPEMKVNSIFRG